MDSVHATSAAGGRRHAARAAVVRAASHGFEIEAVSLEDPRDDEVLVRLVATGVCHTDLIARDQIYPVPQPIVLGHEGAGIVEKVGAGVSHVEPGDHLVLTYLSCGDCPACNEASPAYCHKLFGLCFGGARPDGSGAIRDANGEALHGHFFGQSSFATLAIASRRNVVKVRRDAPWEILGPLGCGLQTGAGAVLNVFRPEAGQSLAVFGAGAVGLSALMAARHAVMEPIIVIDVVPERLQIARDLGWLIVPSPERALDLNRATRALVVGQDYTHGRDPLPAPVDAIREVEEIPTGVLAHTGPRVRPRVD